MAPERLAFVCPRFAGDGAVGGAETLLKNLAARAARLGFAVDFLTTCAQSHYTWDNTLPPGRKTIDDMDVHFFPVDERNTADFLRIQQAIDRGHPVPPGDELHWLRNGVCSTALMAHLDRHAAGYRAILTGPYLFGLAWFAATAHPGKTLLIPCLHDEPFARLACMKRLFDEVAGCLFNSLAERELAAELFGIPDERSRIVGMGLDPFDADPAAFAARRGLSAPYVLYSGRREPLKGTPLLCDYLNTFRERTRRDIHLVFTGSGAIDAPPSLRPHLLDAGFVSEQEKHDAMAGALAFIHPSVNGFGIVLLEAFLAGHPRPRPRPEPRPRPAMPRRQRRLLVPPLPRFRNPAPLPSRSSRRPRRARETRSRLRRPRIRLARHRTEVHPGPRRPPSRPFIPRTPPTPTERNPMKPRPIRTALAILAALAVTAGAADLVSNGSGLRTKPILGAMYELDLLVPPALKGADAKTLIEADQPMQLVLTLKSGLINRKRFVETTTGGFAKAAKSGYECAKTPDFLAQFDDTVFRKGDIVFMAYGPDGLTARAGNRQKIPPPMKTCALGTLPGLNLKKPFAICPATPCPAGIPGERSPRHALIHLPAARQAVPGPAESRLNPSSPDHLPAGGGTPSGVGSRYGIM